MDFKEMLEQMCKERRYSFREFYSGRYMYDQNCVGAVTNAEHHLLDLINDIYMYAYMDGVFEDEDTREEFGDIMTSAKIDDMGKHTILYFPTVETEWEE